MNATHDLQSTPSRLRRFACMMYEGVLLFGVVFIASYLFDTLTQSKHGLMLRDGRQVWLFLVIGLYFVLCWRRRGQTLPMKTWNIRLVDRDGQPPSTPAAGPALRAGMAAAPGRRRAGLAGLVADRLALGRYVHRAGAIRHFRVELGRSGRPVPARSAAGHPVAQCPPGAARAVAGT
ncbi:hypothetical protein FR5810_02403 [Bordetella pertussis]|nr:hypothetical protein FR5810_02403 [Bordetella pertussis]